MPASNARPSLWRTPFALRAYVAGGLWAAGVLTAWVMHAPDQPGWLAIRLDLAGLLYTGAAFIGGLNFMGAGWRALRQLRLDMNFLMSAAIVGAILIGDPFEAATLAFLFSVAELLERFAVNRGRRSLELLLRLAPERADLLGPGDLVTTVPVESLKVGDRIRVRPGDKLPADGRVVAGDSAVNEATITGESLPRRKTRGDAVFASALNTDGALDVEVTADAAHSTLARIVELVRAGEARRAPIEHLVRRFARVYTPIVTAGAIAVMLLPPLLLQLSWLDWFVRGLTLLVIACPCALVIATPVTVVSALTAAARHGVLIKGGEYLDALGGVRAFTMDKTGTLTTGRLAVSHFETGDATTAHQLLTRVAAAEALSEHPIAAAIVQYAKAQGAAPSGTVEGFRSIAGTGLTAQVDGVPLWVGTEDLVGHDAVATWKAVPEGTMRIYARSGDGAAGAFTLRDQLRPEARDSVAALHRLGIRPIVMLTGDGDAMAAPIGREAGVDEVRTRLLPADKVIAVRELRARHGGVAMLGDGVNDAPALAEATVGLAMGAAGSPATIETADIALMGDDLTRLPYVVDLARRARRTIRFNLTLALGLKLTLAVGALFGVASLAEAVLLGDMGASLVVTVNALLLGRSSARTFGRRESPDRGTHGA
ncbi:MAG: cation-translocating P-type ATPase [Gemmatimonadota bacterium]|nr:cation-translocating P-type ATPase [Gemmatimonadota bacterium]